MRRIALTPLAAALAVALPAPAAEPAGHAPQYQALPAAVASSPSALKPKLALPSPAPLQHELHATIGADGRLEVDCHAAANPSFEAQMRERHGVQLEAR